MIESTVEKVKDGSSLVSKTNEAFHEVSTGAAKVGDLVGEIATASNEQSQGIEQVNLAVAEMDKVVQQVAANAEESASASEEMNAQAEQIRKTVKALTGLVGREKHGDTNRKSRISNLRPMMEKPGGFASEKLVVPKQMASKDTKALMRIREEQKESKRTIPLDEDAFEDF
jgi:methyl-accepting chemotaxis protein